MKRLFFAVVVIILSLSPAARAAEAAKNTPKKPPSHRRIQTGGGEIIFEASNWCWTEAKAGKTPMGDLLIKPLREAAARLRMCVYTYPKLRYAQEIGERFQHPFEIACSVNNMEWQMGADGCAGTSKSGLITVIPRMFESEGCTPGRSLLHEMLHASGVPEEKAHNRDGRQTENDAVYGIDALCWGGKEEMAMLRYSQCAAALLDPGDLEEFCGAKKFQGLCHEVVNIQFDIYDQNHLCGDVEPDQCPEDKLPALKNAALRLAEDRVKNTVHSLTKQERDEFMTFLLSIPGIVQGDDCDQVQ